MTRKTYKIRGFEHWVVETSRVDEENGDTIWHLRMRRRNAVPKSQPIWEQLNLEDVS